jgi:hypothetical protein
MGNVERSTFWFSIVNQQLLLGMLTRSQLRQFLLAQALLQDRQQFVRVFGNRCGMPQYIVVIESKSSQGAPPWRYPLSNC